MCIHVDEGVGVDIPLFLMSTCLILGDSSVKFYSTPCFRWFDFLTTMSLCFWMFLVSM